nr:DMT family transporter [Micromonospora sp. DSM 115978]
LGVVAFSLTLPATRAAADAFGGWTVGFGRAVVAALLAAVALRAAGQPLRPPAAARSRIMLVALGVVLGFPVLTSVALQSVSSSHAAVFVGLLPAATAGMAVWLVGERPRPLYWVALFAGVAAVTAFAVSRGAGGLELADLLLLAAVGLAAVGYAEGGALAREHGGWQVISLAVVASLPLTVPATVVAVLLRPPSNVDAGALVGFGYVAAISMFGGFVVWYAGMAREGVARVGRLQLAQPVLTLG